MKQTIKLLSGIFAAVCLFSLPIGLVMALPIREMLAADICFATFDDGVTVESSTASGAVQRAIDAAPDGATVKIAGDCRSVSIVTLEGGEICQVAYISKGLTLEGGHTPSDWTAAADPIANPTILNGFDLGRVIVLHNTGNADFTVTLRNLIVERGDAQIGDDVAPFNENGGGIFVDEGVTLRLEDSVVRDSFAFEGGGLYNIGTTTIERSRFVENNADHGGGIANVGFGTLTVHNRTDLSDNLADTGGGIYNSGVLIVDASRLSDNQAIPFDAATRRIGGSSGAGGAIFSMGSAEIHNTDINNNSASNGGGIFNADNLDPSEQLLVSQSTLRSNMSTLDGGGIFNESRAMIANSTLSGNHAQGLGGAIFGTARVLVISIGTSIFNSTLSDNRADGGVNGESAPANNGAAVHVSFSNLELGNTIIANSVGGVDCIDDSFGGVADFGHNLIESSTDACGLTDGSNNNTIGQDPDLAPLADNGSAAGSGLTTLTHALLANSPAIDAANPLFCSSASINGLDQRNFDRDADCDIGAFEANGVPTAVTVRQSDTSASSAVGLFLLVLCMTILTTKLRQPDTPKYPTLIPTKGRYV